MNNLTQNSYLIIIMFKTTHTLVSLALLMLFLVLLHSRENIIFSAISSHNMQHFYSANQAAELRYTAQSHQETTNGWTAASSQRKMKSFTAEIQNLDATKVLSPRDKTVYKQCPWKHLLLCSCSGHATCGCKKKRRQEALIV